jgi:hypothetical protein
LRQAVHALHAAGFRVQIDRGAEAGATAPAAGVVTPVGTVVRLAGTR